MPDLLVRLQTGLAGAYSLERELGRGGMARVFLARDRKHERLVALKVLDPGLAAVIGSDRFLREIRVAARLQHPHILTVHDSGEIPGADGEAALLWFTMPYVEGETLRERVRRELQLPLADAVAIAREVADALACAHAHGVIHRDIKPENLLLTGGHTMVADFGVARAVGEEGQRLTGTGLAIGTPAYMSPEQATGDSAVDGRSDIYALGCVLYEMIAGEPPYSGPNPLQVMTRAMTEAYRPLHAVRETVTPALEQVVGTALARAPADRYQRAADMARALGPDVLTPSAVIPARAVPTGSASARQPAIRSHRRAILLAGLALLLLAAVAGILLLPRGKGVAALDGNLIAVAPFDLVSSDQELAVWSEGIVDVVARYFDGAGTLRAVAPTRAIRAWDGRADRESAERFGRAVGARYVVFGQLIGSDSARVTATLYDLAGPAVVDEHEWRGTIHRMDRLADSLATRFLDVLGRTHQLGAPRVDPFGTSNPLAIRAFLSGMRDLRRASYAGAREHFLESVAHDTGFVLGRLYAREAVGWLHGPADTAAIRLAFEAAARNHGLTPRDSLMVVAESLNSAIYLDRGPAFGLRAQLWHAMDTLVARYQNDPEIVYWVTDLNYHQNLLGKRARWHLEGFRRAIELDPLFAPAYQHAVELSAMLDPPEATQDLIRRQLAIPGIDSVRAEALRLTSVLVDPGISSGAKQAALDSAPENVLKRANVLITLAPDSVSLMAARAVARRFPHYVFGLEAGDLLTQRLVRHGRLREATRRLPGVADPLYRLVLTRELASVGAVPLATFDSLSDAVRGRYDYVFVTGLGVPLWLAAHDSARLRTFANVVVRDLRDAEGSPSFGQALLELQRGDSSVFRNGVLRNPGYDPGIRAWTPFGTLPADLSLAFDREDQTWQLLQSSGPPNQPIADILWMLYRARMAEKRGERDIAVDDYSYIARLWSDADEPLRAYAEEARRGLARLSAEP